ncbi:tRNA guanosine(34) transglycosylase Tgt [soil metagenome]
MFEFKIEKRLPDRLGRTGIFTTPHQKLETPELAIVATEAEIRAVPKEYWDRLPCRYLIVNTYHTFTKEIIPKIHKEGGVHGYMSLPDRTIATDSGGFQVFSLGFGKKHQVGKLAGKIEPEQIKSDDTDNLVQINEEGVSFEFDGRPVSLTPESSMDLQHKIGADIMFAFDECTSPFNSKEYTKNSMERTHRWLTRCIKAHAGHESTQALFGIVQGGEYRDLREESARFVGAQDVPGFGLGGSLGRFKEEVHAILDWIIPILPEEKPRHFLGIGQVRDIFEGVERGVDLFDCVIPTREARHRMVYTKKGRLSLRKMRTIQEPIDSTCGCFGCREGVTYEQLWELFKLKDTKAAYYATAHNIWFFSDLMKEIRAAINSDSFFELKESYYKYY